MSLLLRLPLIVTLLLGPISGAVAAPEAAPVAEQEAVSVPFAHAVGERWGLRLEHEVREGGSPAEAVVEHAEVRVVSPLRRGFLVEVTWTQVERAGAALALQPRRAASAPDLDRLGGGHWRLHVDVRGSAQALQNDEEVRVALARAAGGALDDATWETRRGDLLERWNVVYAACGVPLVPAEERITPLVQGDAAPRGEDVRVLHVERTSSRAVALTVKARTRMGGPDAAPRFERRADTRFDLATRRLSGWSLLVQGEAAARRVERLAFAEVALDAPPEGIAAR